MNPSIKVALLSVGLLSLMGLTACQSTPTHTQTQQNKVAKGEEHRYGDRHHHAHDRRGMHARAAHAQHLQHRGFSGPGEDRRAPMTAEQRGAFEKVRAERQAQRTAHRQAIQDACAGKIGQEIAIKIGEKPVNGTCQVNFRPTRSPQTATPVQIAPQGTTPVTQPINQTAS